MNERNIFEEKMCHKLTGLFNEILNQYDELTDQLMWEAWQYSASREGYKLVPTQPRDSIICAIENKVQEQLDASAISADMFRLDGEKIFDAVMRAMK